jgi:hypothetical protein
MDRSGGDGGIEVVADEPVAVIVCPDALGEVGILVRAQRENAIKDLNDAGN